MTAAVKQLVRRFEADLRAAALDALLLELGKLMSARRARNDNARPAAPPRSPRRRRRRRRPAVRPTATIRRRRVPRAAAAAPMVRSADVTGVTDVTSPTLGVEPRAVVVRIDGNPSKIALLEGTPAPGFYCVRLAQGRGRYSHKRRRIIERELLRDATPREITLGYVVPGLTQ